VLAVGGLALHAAVLGFSHPATGVPLRLEASPPPAFAALLVWLRERPADSPGTGPPPAKSRERRV